MLKKAKKAFTLLELILVIVVLGILAAIAVPRFADVQTKASESVAMANATTLVRAAQQAAANDDSQTFAEYVDSIGTTYEGFDGEDYGSTVIGTITIKDQTVTIANNGIVRNTGDAL